MVNLISSCYTRIFHCLKLKSSNSNPNKCGIRTRVFFVVLVQEQKPSIHRFTGDGHGMQYFFVPDLATHALLVTQEPPLLFGN